MKPQLLTLISLPIMLAALANRAEARQSSADALGADARLHAKRTIRVHDQPIRDLLGDLNLQTGVKFFADPAVSEDRVTVIAHDRPLAETLRAVAGLFRFSWKRDGKSGDYSYTLFQAPGSAASEAKEREALVSDSAEWVRREITVYDRLDALSDAQLTARSDQLNKELASDSLTVQQRRELALESSVCEQLKSSNEWRRILNRILLSVPPDTLTALLRGGRTDFAWPPTSGFEEVAPDTLRNIREMKLRDDTSDRNEGYQISFIRLNLFGEQGRSPSIRWQLTIGRRSATTYSSSELGGSLPSLPIELSPSQAGKRPGIDWSNDPALKQPASINLPSTLMDEANPGGKPRRSTLGDALIALDKSRPIDVVSDAFQGTRITGFTIENQPVGEALDRLARLTAHRWTREAGFVSLRSAAFAVDRYSEPPASLVSQWMRRVAGGGMDLDDLAQIAALPDAQLLTLQQMAKRGDFPDELGSLFSARDHLRLWNALSRAQRRATENEGVPYSSLNASQKLLMAQAITERRFGSGYSRISPGLVESSRLKVEVKKGQIWGVRKRNGAQSMAGYGSREEAFQYFQSQDPALRPGDLKQVIFATVRFVYESNRGLLAQAWMNLPGRWEDAP